MSRLWRAGPVLVTSLMTLSRNALEKSVECENNAVQLHKGKANSEFVPKRMSRVDMRCGLGHKEGLETHTPHTQLESRVIVLERQSNDAPLTRVSLDDLILDCAEQDRRLLLFGEQHDDSIGGFRDPPHHNHTKDSPHHTHISSPRHPIAAQEVQRVVYSAATSSPSEKKVALALEFIDADSRGKVAEFNSSPRGKLQHHRTSHLFRREEEVRNEEELLRRDTPDLLLT